MPDNDDMTPEHIDRLRGLALDYGGLWRRMINYLDRTEAERTAAWASVEGVDLREGHQRDNATPDELRHKLLGAGLEITRLREQIEEYRKVKFVYSQANKLGEKPPTLNDILTIGRGIFLEEENKFLVNAIREAGFSILKSSDKWTLCDVSERGKAEESRSLEVANRNVELEVVLMRLINAVGPVSLDVEEIQEAAISLLSVECPACSAAGGADRAVHHLPPVCSPESL